MLFRSQPIDHIKIRVTVSTEVCYTPSQCEATVSSTDECVILPTHPLFLSDTQCAPVRRTQVASSHPPHQRPQRAVRANPRLQIPRLKLISTGPSYKRKRCDSPSHDSKRPKLQICTQTLSLLRVPSWDSASTDSSSCSSPRSAGCLISGLSRRPSGWVQKILS